MALQSKNADNEPPDMEELLNDLGHRLDRLKQLYEMYFLGIEKMEPQVARKEVQRTMLMLQQMNIRNTGLRFKLNALVQKWNIYQTYWGRTVREMENGTYVRHLQRMKRNAERDGKDLPAEVVRIRERLLAGGAAAAEEPAKPAAAPAQAAPSSGYYSEFDSMKNFLDDETGDFPRVEDDEFPIPRKPTPTPVPTPPTAPVRAASKPLPPPPPPTPNRAPSGPRPAPPPPPGAAPITPRATVPTPQPKPTIPGMNESELRALHQSYTAARQSSGESKVSYEGLVGSLAKQLPKILEQPGVKGVKFEVVTKDGKAIVKAIPQK